MDDYENKAVFIGKVSKYMTFDYALSTKFEMPSALCVNVIYLVHADNTYDVKVQAERENDSDEIYILIFTFGGKGQMEFRDGSVFELLPNTLFVIKYREAKRYLCKGNQWDFWWFEVSCLNLPLTIHKTFELTLELEEEKLCVKALDLLREGWDTTASTLVCALVYYWKSRMERSKENSSHLIFRRAVGLMRRFQEYKSLLDICTEIDISEHTLWNVFMRECNMGPKKYHDQIRIEAAAEMIRNTGMYIKEIADFLGFSSQYHLSRAFHKYYGVSPKAYKNKL
jgi:AraC family transcriptional regulator of arabinose operon